MLFCLAKDDVVLILWFVFCAIATNLHALLSLLHSRNFSLTPPPPHPALKRKSPPFHKMLTGTGQKSADARRSASSRTCTLTRQAQGQGPISASSFVSRFWGAVALASLACRSRPARLSCLCETPFHKVWGCTHWQASRPVWYRMNGTDGMKESCQIGTAMRLFLPLRLFWH